MTQNVYINTEEMFTLFTNQYFISEKLETLKYYNFLFFLCQLFLTSAERGHIFLCLYF